MLHHCKKLCLLSKMSKNSAEIKKTSKKNFPLQKWIFTLQKWIKNEKVK